MVGKLLDRGSVESPPIDSEALAHRLGMSVVIDDEMEERARWEEGETVSIIVNPDERDEQEQFRVAHELGEQYAQQVFESISESQDGFMSDSVKESLANRIASRILLPNPWFQHEAAACDYDIVELKRIFFTASHEVIARRMLDADGTITVMTILDNGKVHWRLVNHTIDPGQRLSPFERECWERCHEAGDAVDSSDGIQRVQVWPIWENGWKREVVRMSVDCDW